jgi:septum site-determining protein MinD
VSAIRDADRVIGKLNERDLPIRLIVNRVRPEMVRSGDMMSVDDVVDILGVKLIGLIPDDEEIIDTTNRGEPIVLTPDSRLGEIYEKIARRVDGEHIPFTTLTAPGFFGRLFGQRKAG